MSSGAAQAIEHAMSSGGGEPPWLLRRKAIDHYIEGLKVRIKKLVKSGKMSTEEAKSSIDDCWKTFQREELELKAREAPPPVRSRSQLSVSRPGPSRLHAPRGAPPVASWQPALADCARLSRSHVPRATATPRRPRMPRAS